MTSDNTMHRMEDNNIPLARRAPRIRVGRLRDVLVGDNRLQIGALPPLLAAIAIGGCRGNACHLFSFVDYGFLDVTPIHHPSTRA
jgi:hypothetical protein